MVKFHGNWCGPNWTAGQRKSARLVTKKDRNVPAVDELDQCCKTHDLNIADKNPDANEIFIKQTEGLGIKAQIASKLVGAFGPSRDEILQEPKMKQRRMRFRSDKDKNFQSPGSLSNSRSKRTVQFASPNLSKKKLRMNAELSDSGDIQMMSISGDSANSANGENGTGETPVLYREPQLGLFGETHTAVLPIRFGMSFCMVRSNPTDHVLRLRLNAPYDILTGTNFVNQQTTQQQHVGIGTHQCVPWNINNTSVFNSFETTLEPPTGLSQTTTGSGVIADSKCIPGWRSWFEKIYESYHTLETQYRVTFVNTETSVPHRARIYQATDVYTQSSTGNVIPIADNPLMYNSTFKDVDYEILQERNNNDSPGWIKTIEGTWRPGVYNKNTVNSEDIKAWYATGAGPSPLWFEQLVLFLRTDEYNINTYTNVNCFVELRYHVQFKDLKQTFRYTQPQDSTIALNTPGDVLQVPNIKFAAWAGVS